MSCRLLPTLALLACCASAGLAQQLVWPLSGTSEPVGPPTATFGPQIDPVTGSYRFHRGIDLPAAPGTPVYAVADGTVLLAGVHRLPSEDAPLVQLRHARSDGSYFYSSYLYLDGVAVEVGDGVVQGALIGYTGGPAEHASHLHFEILDQEARPAAAVHPLAILPRLDASAPVVEIESVDDSDPLQPVVMVVVSVRATEADLARVDARVYDGRGRRLLDFQSFDAVSWSTAWEDPELLDQPDLAGIELSPQPYDPERGQFVLRLRFHELRGAPRSRIEVQATDVHGRTATATWPPAGPPPAPAGSLAPPR